MSGHGLSPSSRRSGGGLAILFFLGIAAMGAAPPAPPSAAEGAPAEGAAPVEGGAEAAPAPMSHEELVASLVANGMEPKEAEALATAHEGRLKMEAALNWQHGEVVVAGNRVTLHLPEGFGYLRPLEADKVMTAWGNPPGSAPEGLLAPMGVSLFGPEGWAVVLSYTDDGHISDDDANEIDYDELMKDMKKGTEEENKERTRAGYPAIHLTGWAEPPHYDGMAKKLYWAKILTNDDGGRTLNYDIRVLGRTGVFSMNALADESSLETVKAKMEEVISYATFNEKHRYADFDEGSDKMAAYGLGALVAGGIAAKSGVFKGLLALLLAGKKFFVLALAAVVGFLRKLFGGKPNEEQPPPNP